jgi:hypothetical protein
MSESHPGILSNLKFKYFDISCHEAYNTQIKAGQKLLHLVGGIKYITLGFVL